MQEESVTMMNMFMITLFLLLACSLPFHTVAFKAGGSSMTRTLRLSTGSSSWSMRRLGYGEQQDYVVKRNIFACKPISSSLFASSNDLAATATMTSTEVVASTSEGVESGKTKPKDLFARFGIAYLLTSITLSIISYASFYYMIKRGVDVSSLLAKVGIEASTTSATTGTAALAYAMHKAASPIRFPPTVALTPLVARLIGYKPKSKSTANTTEEKK